MPTSTVLKVADAVAATISARCWSDVLAPSAVTRLYLPDVEDIAEVRGRQVYVWPVDYGQADTSSRAEDLNEYRIGVMIVEIYPDAGRVSREWLDERVDFVNRVYDTLSDIRIAGGIFPDYLSGAYCWTAHVGSVYDAEELRERKTFVSTAEYVYRINE